MSGKERGVMQLIWKSFASSLRPYMRKKKLVGEDYYGTKYYEETNDSKYSRKRPPRSFVPVNKDDHEQELPAEWEAWLRYRRVEPPTNEEIQKNYELSVIKKQKAAEIEALYSKTRAKDTNVPVVKRGRESFPTYEEYKPKGR